MDLNIVFLLKKFNKKYDNIIMFLIFQFKGGNKNEKIHLYGMWLYPWREWSILEKCPQCGAPKSKFIEKSDAILNWADEHKIGVGADIDAEVLEGLKANFTGECTEVGKCTFAMSRQADREGYPEVAEVYKRIAFEEAEHAFKLAELLGEVVYADTRKNLQLRVEAEFGASEGKKITSYKSKTIKLWCNPWYDSWNVQRWSSAW